VLGSMLPDCPFKLVVILEREAGLSQESRLVICPPRNKQIMGELCRRNYRVFRYSHNGYYSIRLAKTLYLSVVDFLLDSNSMCYSQTAISFGEYPA